MSNMNYLTDEELENLISDVEQYSMLPAPSYLKEEILRKASVPDYKKKLQFYAYSVKVCAAAAAAIVLLFAVPVQPEKTMPETKISITGELSRHTSTLCDSLNRLSDALVSFD